MATSNLGMGGSFTNGGNIWDMPNMGMAQNLWDAGKAGAPIGTQNTAPDPAKMQAAYDSMHGVQPSANLGMGAAPQPAPQAAPQANPYLDKMAEGITSQMNDNWTRNLLPSIRSGAMAAGGFGGSRQGVVEANGLNDLNRTLSQSLSSLYGQDWTNQQNRNLQQQQITNQNNQYYSGLDSNNAQFGANLGLNTMNAQNQWALNGVNAANQIQNAPINYFNGFNNNTNTAAGQGGSQSGTVGSSSNPTLQGLGLMQYGSNNGGGMNNIGGADFTKYLMNGSM